MSYVPNTSEDRKKMLAAIGVSKFEDLLDAVPQEVRLKKPLNIPPGASELELMADLRKLSRQNVPVSVANSFLGGGFYDHFTPTAADFIIRRAEFLTAYTPYQPEVAQGTLQVIYEFQSLIAALTKMEAANASLYDGASAVAEAALMAAHITEKKEILVTDGLNPNYLAVLKTYGTGGAYQIKSLPLGSTGQLEPEFLKKNISGKTAGLILQTPNFFGCLEEAKELKSIVHSVGAKLITVFDPISLGMMAPPGEYNADIAVAEGQSLGVPISYGGPAIGLFAAKKELVRRMPGRITARTLDVNGKVGYVLTLQTREQHIRREKATSNICTNQGLMATLSTVFMSLVGKEGLKQMAELSYAKAHYCAGLLESRGFKRVYSAPFFKEFAVELPVPASKAISKLHKSNLVPGIDLGRYDRKRKNQLLIAVTEKKSRGDIEAMVEGLCFFRTPAKAGMKPEEQLETAAGSTELRHETSMNQVVEPTIFDLSSPGRRGVPLPKTDVPEPETLPQNFQRQSDLEWPEASEIDVMRHFVRLSVLNHHIEKGIYPLGSCTMKYNPKVNEAAARLPGFGELHPEAAEEDAQGALRLMYELSGLLAEIGGVDAVTLQPSAGAQGELVGLLLMRAYHTERKDKRRNQIIIPDSAHGTNPASVAIAGWETVQITSGVDGRVSLEKLTEALTERTAGMMLTNPNTLGLFEKEILEICRLVHEAGGLMYMDGANLNALLGIVRPGELGFDIAHFNLHKTFSTPHGGGGPGAGAVGVKKFLEPYLPNPRVEKVEKNGKTAYRFTESRKSIGKVHSAFGNFGVLVRAYTYIRTLGTEGLREVSENAIINANYLFARIKDYYEVPYPGFCQHEFVLSGNRQKALGVRTMDIAKRLLDFGVHAPTAYFPLIVPEALMIEPTETESRESLDYLADAFIQIAKEAETEPERVRKAPHNTPVGRLDEARAAKDLDIAFHKS